MRANVYGKCWEIYEIMTENELQFDNTLPKRVIETTRALYAPPGGESYWSALEAKIMARIATTPPVRWWQVLGGWARVGLVAAAAILMIATMLLTQATNRQEIWAAYDEVIHPVAEPLPIPAGVLSEWDGLEARGATFRDVISR
jgi:hypothetical protein